MISQISGILIFKKPTEIVVDCSGVGYQIFTSVNTSDKLDEVGSKVTLQTYLIHREDTMQIYGFYDDLEREVFKLLITISGIGPKSAIAILSSISIVELKQSVIESNYLLLQKMPGIGKKTAERLVIELRDKMLKIDIGETNITSSNVIAQEAVSALVVLGYNKITADKAVAKAINSLTQNELTVENILRLALKFAIK